jgi:2-hydroxychromene-2-carboxylate isomerase
MTQPIDFWFEFASTYSYPAAARIEHLARSQGVPIRWRAFLLGPIFKNQGWSDSPFNIYPAKGHYMWRDLERICGELQLPLRRPSTFPRNGLLPARIACHFAEAPWLPQFVRAVYEANFARDEDISAVPVIEECLRAAGQSPTDILAAAQSPAAKEQLKRQNETAVRLGIFGAPSFVVGDELFWGNDRLEAALAWSRR